MSQFTHSLRALQAVRERRAIVVATWRGGLGLSAGEAYARPSGMQPQQSSEAASVQRPIAITPPSFGDASHDLVPPRSVEPVEPELAEAPPPPRDTVRSAVLTGFMDAGRPVYRFLDVLGGHLILLGRALAWLPRRPFRVKTFFDAIVYIGYRSIPIVLLVAAFTGMVMSLQLVSVFGQFGLKTVAGGATGKAIALELGPVLTSLMLAGRAGAGMATEIGTMRITEQIDALESMAVNPVQYLITPRIVAGIIVAPILTLLFFIVAMGGAYGIAVLMMNVDEGQWMFNLKDIVMLRDVAQGVIKSAFFGGMLALVGCYQGYNATGGGRGVGNGTTRAVVLASVMTLVMDYFLSDILLTLMPPLSAGP